MHNNTSLDANPKYNKALTPSHLNITHPIQSHASAINSHLITEATPSLNTLDSTSTNSPYFLKSPPITAIKSSSYTQSTPTHTQAPHQSLHSNIYTSHMLDSHATFKAPDDYKFHCFSKQVFSETIIDRGINTRCSFFDKEWNFIPVKITYDFATKEIPKPSLLPLMLEISKMFFSDLGYVRCDFYLRLCEKSSQHITPTTSQLQDPSQAQDALQASSRPTQDAPYTEILHIGELTFTPGGGVLPITPREFDAYLGTFW